MLLSIGGRLVALRDVIQRLYCDRSYVKKFQSQPGIALEEYSVKINEVDLDVLHIISLFCQTDKER